jgi:hypothetical protein
MLASSCESIRHGWKYFPQVVIRTDDTIIVGSGPVSSLPRPGDSAQASLFLLAMGAGFILHETLERRLFGHPRLGRM